MPGFRDFSSEAPRIREHFMRQNPSVGVAACKADPAGFLKACRSARMGELPTLALRGRSMQVTRGTCTGLQQAHQQQHLQSLDTCRKRAVTKACVDAAVAQLIYATGTTFWVVVAISK